MNEFKKDREIHDKIEFNLVETCYSFNSNKRLKKFFNKKILQNYLSELKKITKDILKSNLIKEEKNKVLCLNSFPLLRKTFLRVFQISIINFVLDVFFFSIDWIKMENI